MGIGGGGGGGGRWWRGRGEDRGRGRGLFPRQAREAGRPGKHDTLFSLECPEPDCLHGSEAAAAGQGANLAAKDPSQV